MSMNYSSSILEIDKVCQLREMGNLITSVYSVRWMTSGTWGTRQESESMKKLDQPLRVRVEVKEYYRVKVEARESVKVSDSVTPSSS